MSTTISALTAAASIDATADYIPIVTNNINTTQKINRNTFLNIASQPVGLTDTQALTNKTLTSPTISGPTFSGTIVGTYTIGGTPTFPSSVVTLTGSQTLTNKVLTSPTISAPTITNATISADAVTGFSSSTTGTIYGISIAASKLSGSVITNATIPYTALTTDSTWAWQSWTPTLTNMTLGNGTLACKYTQIGKTVYARFLFTLGSTSAIGTNPNTFTLPVTALAIYGTTTPIVIGTFYGYDASATTAYPGTVEINSSTTIAGFKVANASATYTTGAGMTATVPTTWTTSDIFSATLVYEAA